MHNNPVKGGLVKQPGDQRGPATAERFYFLNDASLLTMDPML
ncbi:MAG: hypothetical protein ABSE93_22170 [Terriglobia bacterium]|jgi:hypothetical protein